tara:strand:+ start:602 stop:1411 length:810 start_codon:yes stop_codon:yes gene_type:complete
MRVELDDLPIDSWEKFLRSRDLIQLLSESPRTVTEPVLEIGCGNGHLTKMLRRKFNMVVPTDVNPRGKVEGLCIVDARSLPFQNNYFGTIVSSNVLEHIPDLPDSLLELKRVLRHDGVMIHTMPTRTWKFLQLALWPVHLIVRIGFPRIASRFGSILLSIRRNNSGAGLASNNKTLSNEHIKPSDLSAVLPGIHGISSTHMNEWSLFGKYSWIRLFESNGLDVLKTTNLFLHSAYRLLPYRFLGLREWASRLGIVSVRGYWISKNQEKK